jgi:carbamoyl-phosphate synthase large subunit
VTAGVAPIDGQFNVLLSSAGRRVALLRAFQEALEELGLSGAVMAADVSDLSSAFHSGDRAFLVPPCTSEAFIPEMLRICRQHGINLVVPTIDTELPVLATHRSRFADIGTVVAVSSPDVIAIGQDKVRTHAWLIENGLPTIPQVKLQGDDSLPNGWRFPALVKPRAGSAAVGVRVVHDRAELEVATRDGEFVMQALAKGNEYTVDVLTDLGGRFVCAVPRRRIEVRAGEVSKGVTADSPAVIDVARRATNALPGPYAALTFQLFYDEDSGEISVIELNPRFGGGFPLTWEAGGRYPRWIIEEILGLPSTAMADGWRDGILMLRFDDAVFVDARKGRS